jgi:pimeloyl-ACP methyl ester carboxylesterase
VHALRFDYRGTGDSAGTEDCFRIGNSVEDALAAREELRASRGLARVGFVGLRLGASVAALAAARCPDLPLLVLWEPIVSGGPYLQELRRMQQAWVDFEAQERPNARRLATEHEVLGYQLPPGLEGDLEALELPPRDARLACRTLLIDEGVGEGLDELSRAIERLGSRVECRRGECGRVWTREVGGEQASVPRELLGAIVDWVTRTDGP